MRQALPHPPIRSWLVPIPEESADGMAGRRIYPYGRWLKLERRRFEPSTPDLGKGKAYRPPQVTTPLISVKCLIINRIFIAYIRVIPHSSGARWSPGWSPNTCLAQTSQKLTNRTIDASRKAQRALRRLGYRPQGFGCRVEPSAQDLLGPLTGRPGGGRNAPKRFFTIGRYAVLSADTARKEARKVLGAVAPMRTSLTIQYERLPSDRPKHCDFAPIAKTNKSS